jgi:hypothetical protein
MAAELVEPVKVRGDFQPAASHPDEYFYDAGCSAD